MNEAASCRQHVIPGLVEVGWDSAPHSIAKQCIFTDGRVFLVRGKPKRGKQKKDEYLLRYTRDFPIAALEAKANYKQPSDGLAQAKNYAQTLDLKFAYSTNGTGIIEFDFLTGSETILTQFPSPQKLWHRRVIREIERLARQVDAIRQAQTQTVTAMSALLASIIECAVRGELI